MKRVINGKRYDTDKARLVCERISGEPGQPGYSRVSLYQKRGGEYFFRHQGPFGVDNIIREPTQQAVHDFIWDNKGVAAYKEEFLSQGHTTISASVTLDCKRKLDRIANDARVPRGKIIETLILAHYAKIFPEG